MSPAERERLLLRWAHSPLALQRSAFQAFRKLLSFLAYAAPGPDGEAANPLLAAIGYAPDDGAGDPGPDDRPPARGRSLVRAMPRCSSRPTSSSSAPAPAAGSSPPSSRSAGRSVLVLEAGPFVDEATMPRTRSRPSPGSTSTTACSRRGTRRSALLAGSAVGGGTLVNWMTCIDIPPAVRAEWAAEHGLDGLDGAEWDADRAAIEAELGVAASEDAPPKDAAILRGAAALGWEAAPTRRNATGCARLRELPLRLSAGAPSRAGSGPISPPRARPVPGSSTGSG